MTSQEFYKHCYNRQFQNMIAYEQIDKDGNIIGTVPNYTKFLASEKEEYYNALEVFFGIVVYSKFDRKIKEFTKKQFFDAIDALADMIVCICGQVITKEITEQEAISLIQKYFINAHTFTVCLLKKGFSFLDIQNEVFDTNFNRIQRDENGNVMKQPAFLENGEPNPEAGKIIRKKLNPNLEQFFNL